MIRHKDREEKSKDKVKKVNAKTDKIEAPAEAREQSVAKPRDLFWDDYSDVGYC